MDTGQEELAGLARKLADEDAFIKVALIRDGKGWTLWKCDGVLAQSRHGGVHSVGVTPRSCSEQDVCRLTDQFVLG